MVRDPVDLTRQKTSHRGEASETPGRALSTRGPSFSLPSSATPSSRSHQPPLHVRPSPAPVDGSPLGRTQPARACLAVVAASAVRPPRPSLPREVLLGLARTPPAALPGVALPAWERHWTETRVGQRCSRECPLLVPMDAPPRSLARIIADAPATPADRCFCASYDTYCLKR